MYISTGNQRFNASGSAKASSLCGSIYRKYYQQLPAHCGIVFVSLRPFIPVSGSTTLIHSSLFANGDSPVPDGFTSFSFGNSNGSSSSGTVVIEPSSQ